jgi:DNA-binding transcriptional MocR family regulator
VIPIDRNSHLPIYVQIEQSVRCLIAQGTFRPGQRLPSTRELAQNLGINRITVDHAYRRLEADGLIWGRVGQGTFVSRTPEAGPLPLPKSGLDPESLSRLWGPLFVDPKQAAIGLPAMTPRRGIKTFSFVYAAPPPDLFPAVEFRRCVDHVLKRRVSEVSQLGASDGLLSLKNYLVHWFAQNGMMVSEENVIITTGCQQSLDLVRRILVGPGDALLLENPTYPGAVGALAPASAGRMELPIREDGPDLRGLAQLAAHDRCKLLYLVPNFHNPTGHTISLETRRQIVAICNARGLPIVEDDVFGELRYEGPVLPPLKALCPHLVIYIGSFSKMLSPGLRLGWIVAPRPVADQLHAVKQSSDLHTNLLVQGAMDEFCRRDLLHRHLKRIRRVFRNRRDAMAEALREWMPSEATWKVPQGGLSMWVTLPPEWNTEDLLGLAQSRGVQFIPGSAFYFRSLRFHSLRLSFASEKEEAIREGIRTLGQIMESRRPRTFAVGQWGQRERSRPIV